MVCIYQITMVYIVNIGIFLAWSSHEMHCREKKTEKKMFAWEKLISKILFVGEMWGQYTPLN